jgi:hypothetical protein
MPVAKPDQIKDAELRGLVAAAREAYLDGDNLRSVEKSIDAFLEMLRRFPKFLTEGPFAGNNRRAWPGLGVTLKTDGVPEAILERREFSNPEAITYYEYVSDCIVAAGL